MKINTQEGYGLRILLSMARQNETKTGLSISEISRLEDMSSHNVAKILRILRLKGFVNSERGQNGGYFLAHSPEKIQIADIMNAMGGRLFDETDSVQTDIMAKLCTDSNDCSLRSLWTVLQYTIDQVLVGITLADLLRPGNEFKQIIHQKLNFKTPETINQ